MKQIKNSALSASQVKIRLPIFLIAVTCAFLLSCGPTGPRVELLVTNGTNTTLTSLRLVSSANEVVENVLVQPLAPGANVVIEGLISETYTVYAVFEDGEQLTIPAVALLERGIYELNIEEEVSAN